MPTGLPQGGRAEVRDQLQQAGLPLSSESAPLSPALDTPTSTAPPAGGGQRVGSFDALANRQPTQPPFTGMPQNLGQISASARFREAAILSPNRVAQELAALLPDFIGE